MTDAWDHIGEHIGDLEIINPDEIGAFHLLPRKTRRFLSRRFRKITRPIVTLPVIKDIVKAGREYGDIMLTPERFFFKTAKGLATGGIKGAGRAIKEEAEVTKRESRRFVQNPVIRYGTKGAALIFPVLTPVAAGVEAANQVIKAVNSKDPVQAALALATVANTAVAANGGDPDAFRAIKTISAVKNNLIPPEVQNAISTAAKSGLGKAVTTMAKSDLGKAATTMAKGKVSFALPFGASKNQAIKAAHSVLTLAHGGGSVSAATAAQALIKNTISAAKAGDPKALQGATVLAVVNKALVAKPGIKAQGKRVNGSTRTARRPGKGQSYSGAYLVDSKGNVLKGNFTAH